MTKPIPPLPAWTCLLVEVGSGAHGTGIPGGEDHDEMGVVVETPEQVLGLGQGMKTVMHRTQPEGVQSGPGDTDRTLYSLRTFLRLAASGNPSIMLALWAPVIECGHWGDKLRELAPAFIGRHIIPRYRGYMQSQAQRLLGTRGGGHGKRGGGGRPELIEAHGFDTKYAMHCARLGFQCVELLTKGRLELPISGDVGDWLRALRRGEVGFDEWWTRVLALDGGLDLMQLRDDIAEQPDRKAIERFSIEAHQAYW